MYTYKVRVWHYTGWANKNRTFLNVDNFAMVSVKEYQELTPLSRIFTCIAHTGVPYFQMGRPKNLAHNPSPNFQGL